MFRILFSDDVEQDLKKIRRYDRNRIMDRMEKMLTKEPTVPTKQRKVLVNLVPPWTAISVVWELRVGDYRVFYDVSEAERRVYVRAIRKKPHGKTTEEIL